MNTISNFFGGSNVGNRIIVFVDDMGKVVGITPQLNPLPILYAIFFILILYAIYKIGGALFGNNKKL